MIKIKNIVIGFLVLLITPSLFVSSVSACDFIVEPPSSESFKSAEIVFIGKVTNRDKWAEMSFKILKQYKGEKKQSINITRTDIGFCVKKHFLVEPEKGQIYVIIATTKDRRNDKVTGDSFYFFETPGRNEESGKKFDSVEDAEKFIISIVEDDKSLYEFKDIDILDEEDFPAIEFKYTAEDFPEIEFEDTTEESFFAKMWSWIKFLF